MPIRISRALFIFLSSSVLTIIYHYNLDSDVSLTHQSNRSIIDQWLKHERFCIFHGIHTGTESDNSSLLEPITLAVHSTTNLAYMVHNQAVHWEGPISLALYIDHRTAESLPLLLRVIQCDLLLSSRLSLHIVFERSSFQNECFNVSIPLSTEPCEEATMHNFKEFSETNPSPFGEYPINLMRNVARRGAPSLLHLVADIEMEFSSNFTLFVTPLANRIVLPKEKRSLVDGLLNGEFHPRRRFLRRGRSTWGRFLSHQILRSFRPDRADRAVRRFRGLQTDRAVRENRSVRVCRRFRGVQQVPEVPEIRGVRAVQGVRGWGGQTGRTCRGLRVFRRFRVFRQIRGVQILRSLRGVHQIPWVREIRVCRRFQRVRGFRELRGVRRGKAGREEESWARKDRPDGRFCCERGEPSWRRHQTRLPWRATEMDRD
ncbi:hypothetical protein PENTCL1PPCAC_18142 [Pristionchus entomophagus]|uniref:Uncharacterized protein n=1 Tax=Pristionchus entomophagus TaxID=358040 RepID=A0AAV5TNH6_9BILA|nr:hypothetical protein PENTCL1PPCAC_18142 [Pristionchus entomophagus]